MIAIVAGHFYTHGGYTVDGLTPVAPNIVFIQFLQMFARIACAVFVLMTGYFYCQSVDPKRQYRKVIPLVFECYFYALLSFGITVLFGGGQFSLKALFLTCFPLFWGNWFVEYYILLMFAVPYINRLLRRLNKDAYLALLLIMYICWSVVPTLTRRAWEFSNIDFMVVMYMTGAYLRMYNDEKRNTGRRRGMALGTVALLLLSVVAFDGVGTVLKEDYFIEHAGYLKEFSSVISVPCAVYTFLLFKDIDFSSRLVNRLAASALGVYLLSDNFLMQGLIWRRIFPNTAYINAPYLHAGLKILAVYMACTAIDMIRQMTVDALLRRYSVYDRVYAGASRGFHNLKRWIAKLEEVC